MSQIATLNRTQDTLLRTQPEEQFGFLSLEQIPDTACTTNKDPSDQLSFLQSTLYRIWTILSVKPSFDTPFAQWYLRLDMPRDPEDYLPWLADFAEDVFK